MTKGAAPRIPGLVFVQPLGSGGYADVFLYEQQSPRMPVAVKVLKSEGLTDALRAQFGEEADTMAALGDHPYIVQVFRSGTSDDGRPYLVMKYYPPPNLAMRARAERFSVEEVLRTGIQLASAVETAHRAHITHRDIKPANVLVSAYGAPGLTDFGIAGRGGQVGADGEVAESTDDVGVSVPWAPPEVLYGQSNGDHRADVYSLAATLWQLLVGRSPFEQSGGDNSAYALMPRIRTAPVPGTGRPDVPPGLERLLAQAMAKDPAHRPGSALELARALQVIEQQQRLARTPIVVLDEQGHTTLVGQPSGPGGSGSGDDDRTRIKAPQTVVAQPSEPSADDHTRRRDGGDSRYSPEPMPAPGPFGGAPRPTTGMPQGGPAAYAQQPQGLGRSPQASPAVRATAVTDPVTSQTSPLDGGVAASAESETLQRSAVSAGAQPVSAPSVLQQPGVLWGLAAGVVVLLGLVLFLLLRPGGEAEPVVMPSPTVSFPGNTDAIPNGVYDPPTVAARSGRGSVSFAWSYPQAEKTDTFRVYVGPRAQDAGKAKPVALKTPSHAVKVPPGTQVCAIVIVNRAGQSSPASEPVCETAQ